MTTNSDLLQRLEQDSTRASREAELLVREEQKNFRENLLKSVKEEHAITVDAMKGEIEECRERYLSILAYRWTVTIVIGLAVTGVMFLGGWIGARYISKQIGEIAENKAILDEQQVGLKSAVFLEKDGRTWVMTVPRTGWEAQSGKYWMELDKSGR